MILGRLIMRIRMTVILLFVSLCISLRAQPVSQEEMKSIYEEVKTPYKYGLVMTGKDRSEATDCPTIFRRDGHWYMCYFVFGGRGYETWLAESDDLLHWNTKGRVLSFSDPEDWDADQKGAYLALVETEWGGAYRLDSYNGRYWMSYFGSNAVGYEKGDLSVGIAYTSEDPSAAHEWKRLDKPVLAPYDADASWWDNGKIYKNSVIEDPYLNTGHRFVMLYNAKGDAERIGIAVSDDMEHWKRFGKDPVLAHGGAGVITGDAYIQKIGDLWVMFYFGAFWNENPRIRAWNSFACSYDLVHWTDWTGAPLIQPSEPYDNKYAHKSCVIKYDGIVYHYYCAVDTDGNRGIALATSKDMGKSTAAFPTE